jgi:predicted Zn-dependent protease
MFYFQFEEQLKEKYLPPDHPYYKYVVETLKTLVIANQDIKEIQSQKWVVAIIDDPEINAFVLPVCMIHNL